MYKSSPFTIVFKYFFPVFMFFSLVFGIYMLWTQGSPESQGFAKGMAVMGVWISFFLVQMPFRLKNIETTENGILIKGFKQNTLVEYRNIHWISKFDFSNPWAVTIKYRHPDSGLDRKINFLPNQSEQRLFGNDAMTQFILEKIKTHNPDYSKDNQPSSFKNILLITLLGLPFVFLFLYLSGFLK